MTLLVLFDVDGTLLLGHDKVYVEANRYALQAVWGRAPQGQDVPGNTALAYTRRTLRSAGLRDDEIDAGLERWCAIFSERYVELLHTADTSHWRIPPDAEATIAAIDRRALLTGNPEPVARARLARLGLIHLFPAGQGAFGCEREDRIALFELCLSRAGDWPAVRCVAVGDTPLDIETAHQTGARCVAVATGAYNREQLAEADRVLDELAELPAALASLSP